MRVRSLTLCMLNNISASIADCGEEREEVVICNVTTVDRVVPCVLVWWRPSPRYYSNAKSDAIRIYVSRSLLLRIHSQRCEYPVYYCRMFEIDVNEWNCSCVVWPKWKRMNGCYFSTAEQMICCVWLWASSMFANTIAWVNTNKHWIRIGATNIKHQSKITQMYTRIIDGRTIL